MKIQKIIFPIIVGLGLNIYFISAFAQTLTVSNDIANTIKTVAPEAENEYFTCDYYPGDPTQICSTTDRYQGKNIPNPYYCPVLTATGGGYSSYLDCWVVTMDPSYPLEVKDLKCTKDPNNPNNIQCSDPYIPSKGKGSSPEHIITHK